MTTFEQMTSGYRGSEYVELMRGIAEDMQATGKRFRCSYCTDGATLLGMQGCGQPGPPVCERHWREQREWMTTAASAGQPYCRHCQQDVTSDHVYVVPLFPTVN